MKRLLLASFILLGSANFASAQTPVAKKQNVFRKKNQPDIAERTAHKNAMLADYKKRMAEEANLKQKLNSTSDVPASPAKHP